MDQPLRVLLVDDNLNDGVGDDCAGIERALRAQFADLELVRVADARAFHAALEMDADLAVTEACLSWSDGASVLGALRARWPRCAVIMCTGTDDVHTAVAALQAGFDDYIVKTASYPEQLCAAARRALELRRAEGGFLRLFERLPIGLYRIAPDGHVLEANPALVQITGCPDGRTLRALNVTRFFVSLRNFEKWRARVDAAGTVRDYEGPLRRFDGAVIWVRNSVRAVRDAGGTLRYYEGAVEDISARRKADAATLRETALLATTLDSLPGVFYVFDDGGRFLRWNHNLERVSGYSGAEIARLQPLDFIEPTQRALVETRFGEVLRLGHAEVEATLLAKDGACTLYHFTGRRVELDGRACVLGVGVDITAQKRAEERLSFLAHYDGVTGLPNRTLFADRLQQAIVDATRNDRLVGVLFLDLDRFKNVNDSLGHEAGDQLLRSVAERLTAVVRRGDTVARLSGDEFTIALADMAQIEDAVRMVQKILDIFMQPFHVAEREIYMTASLGVTLFPDDETELQGLLRNADVAMYRAKESGRNAYQFYSADMTERATESLALENDLRHAIERDELVLYYQPTVDGVSGRVVGVEALVRWRHGSRGLMLPAEFIPFAEESGFIVTLGEWVLRQACRQCREWRRHGYAELRVAINLSARQFRNPGLERAILSILYETGLDPRALDLELTESALLHSSPETLRAMQALAERGVSFSIDDFGTGYSSLLYLKRFPIDVLKVDRSFVQDIPADPDDAAIAQAIITMAHALGMRVIAEGVETPQQAAFMRLHGCDAMQGNLFSRPLLGEELLRLLGERDRLGVQSELA